MSNKQMYAAFVQINREEYLIALTKANPSASVLFNFFLLKMDKLNSITIKYETICEVLEISKSTLQRNLKYLEEHRYIAILKFDLINTYTVNPHIAWRNSYENACLCLFPDIQKKPIMPVKFEKLKKIYNSKGIMRLRK